jgi:hypothetical protein
MPVRVPERFARLGIAKDTTVVDSFEPAQTFSIAGSEFLYGDFEQNFNGFFRVTLQS